MKKTLKKLTTMIVAMALLVLMAVPAYAGDIGLPNKLTLYPANSVKTRYIGKSWGIGYAEGEKVSAKSSNTKVATVKVQAGLIILTPKKAGKTTITVKADGNSTKRTYTIYKYTNPISSVKIGKTTVSGKKFAKSALYTAKYSKYAGKKTAIKFNLKKGWKFVDIGYGKKNWQKSETIKNGQSIRISGGSGLGVCAYVQNKKTGQFETIALYFK